MVFLVLFEHIVISLVQLRLGPNKSSYFGLFQAVFDGLKLIGKSLFF